MLLGESSTHTTSSRDADARGLNLSRPETSEPVSGISARLRLLTERGHSVTELAALGCCCPYTVRRYMLGSTPSTEFITRLCNTIPDLSADWLLLGVGSPSLREERKRVIEETGLDQALGELLRRVQSPSAGSNGVRVQVG